ncbi:hypothetical protein [Frankia sp. Cj3]|uniref:hypothetical protein n=1 Tax=Frankia sp. Cj3 TaxID=2880976 RepID=UPI001EF5371D|nr:hypothetical protein [Frankia sp. Cj3]
MLALSLFLIAGRQAAALAQPAPQPNPQPAPAASPRTQPGPRPNPEPGPSPVAPGTTVDPCPVDPAGPSPAACTVPPAPSATPPSPQTTPTAPDTSTGTGGDGGGPGGVAGWIVDGVTSAINAFFHGLVTAALNPLLELLGNTLLTTPTPGQVPAVGQLWMTSWQITVAGYGILIMIGGIVVMAYGSVQTRTSLKEIAPRIPVAFLAAAFSQSLAGIAISLANSLPGAILSIGVDPGSASQTLRAIIVGALAPASTSLNGSIFVIFLGLVLAGSIVALLCTYIARMMLTVALVGAAPLLLAGHALPQTDGLARWWWRAFGAVLGIQIAQSFVLVAAMRVFFTPGGFTVLGPTPDGVVNLLASITLVYILFKIPFWLLQSSRIGNGRSFVSRLVRAYVMGRALGLVAGSFGGRGGGRFTGRGGRHGGIGRGGRLRSGRPPGGANPFARTDDPYARVEADPNGQLLLPLTRVPRVRRPGPARGVPRPSRPAPGAVRRRPGHRQLALPFDQAIGLGGRYLPAEGGAWIDRDGQYLLPFEVDHLRPRAGSRTSRGASATGGVRPVGPRGRQLELPFDPYQGLRPDRTGQYALPLEGLRRTPRPARPPTPAVPPPVSRPTPPPSLPVPPLYRQLMLPNMPRRRRPPQPGR